MHRESHEIRIPADLDEVLADYMRRVDGGEPVDPEALFAAHPALAAELREYFSQAGAVERFAVGATADFAHQATPRSGLEVRCPSCHAPMDVAVDTALTDLTCSACGSHFSLVDQSKATRMAPSLTKLGRFELIERLGVGGFGSVWKARDKELDRTVAIKIPRQGDMTGEDQEKFFREARAAAQLKHPSIVSVHEVGRDGDSVYIVSDFVRGVTLGDWLTGQQLTGLEAAELCAKIADALDHAHEQGVVHRDLKPANIMMDYGGQPHLMDFGLARREMGEITVTMDGQILGTPAYMSPEQAQGEAHTADRRSDVYSLGVILFQLLTGELPFRGNARMLIKQVIADEPPSPRKLNSNVARDLETITLKCLEKAPVRRYQTAREVSIELRRFLSGEPIVSRPISRPARAWRWAKRRPATAALIALLAGVSVIGPIVAVQQTVLRAQKDSLLAEREQVLADRSAALVKMEIADTESEEASVRRDEALKQLHDKNYELETHLARMFIERGAAECEAGRVFDGIALFGAAHERTRPDDPLRISIRNLLAGWSANLGTTLKHSGSVQTVAFSPDGSTVLTGSTDRTARLWDVHTGSPLGTPMRHHNIIRVVRFHPSGRSVLTGSFDRTARLWDAKTGEPLGKPMRHAGNVRAVAFSPDGRQVLTGSYDRTARIWDPQTGEAVAGPFRHDGNVHAVAYSPDGKTILTGSYDGTARLWDVQSQKQIGEPLRHGSWVMDVAFSPDGKTFVTGADETARLWDATTREPIGEPLAGTAFVVAYSPDGGSVLTGGRDGFAYHWTSRTRQAIGAPMRHERGIVAMAFSPDGQSIVTTSHDRTARLWDAKSGKPLGRPMRHLFAVTAVAFSPDSRLVATGSDDQTARLWDAKTGQPIDFAATNRADIAGVSLRHAGSVISLAFTPNGGTLLTGSENGELKLWDVATRKPAGAPPRHRAVVNAVAVSADGRLAATADTAGIVLIWDVASGQEKWRLAPHRGAVYDVDFSPSGHALATVGADRSLRLWDAETGRPLQTPFYSSRPLRSVAFSPVPNHIAIASDSRAYVLDLGTRESLGPPMVHGTFIFKIAVSPDGKTILTSGDDGNARFWDAHTHRSVGEPLRHGASVWHVDFSPDGQMVLTGAEDGMVRLWDVGTGKMLREPFALDGGVHAAVFSPDGKSFAAGGRNGTARLWQISELPIKPEKITDWVKVLTSLTADEKGIVQPLSQDQWLSAQKLLSGANELGSAVDSASSVANDNEEPDSLKPAISDLRRDVGKSQTVEFEVALTGRASNLAFLNSITDFRSPNCFTVVLDEIDLEMLKQLGVHDLDQLKGLRVRVNGEVEERNGKLQIKVNDLANQLEVRMPQGTWKSPQKDDEDDELETDEWVKPAVSDLRKLVGEEQTVEFRVRRLGTVSAIFLNSKVDFEDRDCFAVVVRNDQVPGFQSIGLSEPEQLLDKLVRVRGTIEELFEYRGQIQILITDVASQLEVQTKDGKWWGARDEAVVAQQKIVAANRDKLGADHPATLESMDSLASKLVIASRFDDATKVQTQLSDQILALSRKAAPYEQYWAAVALLAAGRLDDNRRVCQELLQAYEESGDKTIADRATYAFVSAAVPDSSSKQLVAAAEIVKDRFNGNERILGACLYRAGEYEKAHQAFTTARQKLKPIAWDNCFVAMVHSKLGNEEEAAKALAAARDDHKPRRYSHWYSYVETEELLAEATSLIEGKSTAPPDAGQQQ